MKWEYRNEKLTASNFYTGAVNKVAPRKIIKSLFYSSIKISSIKYGIANERILRPGESKLNVHISIFDVLKDKKFYLEKANGKIHLKISHEYFYQTQGQ